MVAIISLTRYLILYRTGDFSYKLYSAASSSDETLSYVFYNRD